MDIHADLIVSLDGFSQFTDIFLDDFFSDFDALEQIKSSKAQVRHVIEQVKTVIRQLQESRQKLQEEIDKLNEKHDRLVVDIEL